MWPVIPRLPLLGTNEKLATRPPSRKFRITRRELNVDLMAAATDIVLFRLLIVIIREAETCSGEWLGVQVIRTFGGALGLVAFASCLLTSVVWSVRQPGLTRFPIGIGMKLSLVIHRVWLVQVRCLVLETRRIVLGAGLTLVGPPAPIGPRGVSVKCGLWALRVRNALRTRVTVTLLEEGGGTL